MKFTAFNLKKELTQGLQEMGYEECTKVQELTIPRILQGKNLFVQSATGSGKTHSFLVPIINNIDTNEHVLQCLIITPTRELAKQTYDFAVQFTKFVPDLKVRLLIGGKDRKNDEVLASNAPHILIGTPGRLHDVLVKQSLLKLGLIDYIVLDEADMMLEMGYFNDIHDMIGGLKAEAQMMVFSATYPQKLESDLKKYISADEKIKLGDVDTSKNVKHYAIDRKHVPLNEATLAFINQYKPYFLLIFCSKKDDVNSLHRYLVNHDVKAGIIHGDLSQRERKNNMKEIRLDKYPVVVCSDMASRGIDLKNVTCVLNFDIPVNNTEFYFHRAGRTGRLNQKGECYSFYNVDDIKGINKIADLGVDFSWLVLRDGKFVEAKTMTKKKARPKTEEQKQMDLDIKKATSKVRSKKVKPNYKKKVKLAADKVKKKYRRDAIKKSIRKELEKKFRNGNN